MQPQNTIPAFGLYGEPDHFPDVVHCETISARAPLHDWNIAAHRHGQMSQLFLIIDGKIRTNVDNNSWNLTSGEFLYVPALCVHQFNFEPGTEGLVFSFPLSVIQSVGPNGKDVLNALSQPFFGTQFDTLLRLTELLKDVAERHSAFRQQIAVALTHSLLSVLAETRGAASGAPGGAGRIAVLDALITEHFADGWSAADFAEAMSISTGHLSRICRAATGMGATAYIERRVMTEACRYLAFTQLPVSEIGYRLGYADPSYFTKRFSRAKGQSPTSYRSIFTT